MTLGGARLAKIKVSPDQSLDMLNVKRTRPRWSSPGSGRRRGSNRPVVTILSPILSPTLDESAGGVLRSPGTGTVPATGDVVPESNGEVTKDGLVADESTNASTAEAWPLPDGGAGPSVPSSEPRGIGSPRTVDRAIVADDPQQAQESGTLHASAGQGQVHDETSVEATGRNGSLDEAPIVGTLPPDSLTLDGPQERNDDMAAMPGAGTNASEKPRVTTDSHIDVHSLNTRNKGETADEHGSINVETRAARQSVVSETSTGDGEIGAYVPPDRSLRTPARRLSDAPRVSVLSMAARFDTVASPARSIRASHPGLYGVRPSSTQTEFVRTPVPNRRETLVYNNRRSYGSDDGTVLSYATTPDPTPATRDSTILPNPLRPATFAAARAGIPSANWRETPQLNGNSGSPRRYSDWRWSPAGSPSAGAAARLSDSPSPQPSLSPFGTTTSERSRSVAVSTQLHQEIRALRKRLDALVEENGQLRKAAEVRSVCQPAARTVDQKGSKRASVVTAVEVHDPESAAVWRERAERAEARLDAYERFVARVRSIIARPGGYSAVAMAASPDEKRASRLAQSLRLNGTASMGDNRSGSAPSPSSDTATEVDDDEVGSSARRLSSVVEKQGGTGEHEKARKRVNGNGVSIVRPSSSGSTCSNRSVDTIHSNTATASVAEELPLDGRGRGWMTTPARATSATMKNGCIKNDRRRNGIFLERGGLGSEAVAIWMAVQDLLREVGDGSNRG